MPQLAESTPEEDKQADASNSPSLYKVTPSADAFENVAAASNCRFCTLSVRVCASTPQVSDATGSMTMTKVSEKSPFAKDLLVRGDCFILDNGANGKVFVWKGEGILRDPGSGRPRGA